AGTSGVFNTTLGLYPTNIFNNTNYWVDVIFNVWNVLALKGDKGDTGITTIEGFSAHISNGSQVLTSGTLNNWISGVAPYFNTGNFNTLTGEYIVLTTGNYHIDFIFNYYLSMPINTSLGNGIPNVSI